MAGGRDLGAVRHRSHAAVRRLVAELKAEWRAAGARCRRCGMEIDYDAAVGEPNALNAGHVKPWSTHPELRLDRGNYQPEHESCNKSAGARTERPGLGLRSREW